MRIKIPKSYTNLDKGRWELQKARNQNDLQMFSFLDHNHPSFCLDSIYKCKHDFCHSQSGLFFLFLFNIIIPTSIHFHIQLIFSLFIYWYLT